LNSPRLRREWRDGLKGLVRWIRTPSDLPNAFACVFSLAGPSVDREFRAFAQHPVGRGLLAESPRGDLNALLSNEEKLEAMPEGSFGRAYLDYLDQEGMASAEAFLEAAGLDGHARRLGWSDDQLWFVKRMANSHDLFHVLSGYDRSIIGEIGVDVYTAGQIPLLPLKLMLPYFLSMSPGQFPTWFRFVRAAYRNGRQTPSLACVDYEAMFPLPLDEVRAQLGVPSLGEVHPQGLPRPGKFLGWLVRRVEKS
jgi:ubiquinone biosynthesis protein COQ4